MNLLRRYAPRNRLIYAVPCIATLAAAPAGCGKDEPQPQQPGPGPSTTSYKGTITGSTVSGVVTLRIDTANPAPQAGTGISAVVNAVGAVVLTGGGGTADMTGTYDDEAETIGLSGDGWILGGGLSTFGMEGATISPIGVAVFSAPQQGAGSDTVHAFTGTSQSLTGGAPANFNFSIRAAALHGSAVDTTGTVTSLEGTFAASDSTITIVDPANPPGPAYATGKWHPNDTATGTYDDHAGNSGTWTTTKSP
jgi:hypothetical protein